jgi:hypothetical protein
MENPFDTGTGNNITNVVVQPYMGGTNDVPDPKVDAGWDSSVLYEFTQSGGYGNGETYFSGFGWYPGVLITAPGTGFFLLPKTNSTVTFTGSVVLGSTNNLPKGASLVGSAYAGATTLTGLGLVGNDSDVIYRFYSSAVPAGYSGSVQSYGGGVTYFAGYGWYDADAPTSSNAGNGGGSTNGPVLNVGEGFFYIATQPLTWTQNFTVN